jgi:hypothetical protein
MLWPQGCGSSGSFPEIFFKSFHRDFFLNNEERASFQGVVPSFFTGANHVFRFVFSQTLN